MRILIWSFVEPHPESAYWFWLKKGMEDVGHQVIAVDAFALTSLFGLGAMQEILLAYADAYRVQAAVVVPQSFVETWFLDALRQRGVAVVVLRYDDGMAFADGVPGLPPPLLEQFGYADAHCDLSVTICRRAGEGFARRGLPVPVYLPFPYNWQSVPLIERPRRPVVAFAGSPKERGSGPLSARVAIVRGLAQAGLPVEAYHADWAAVPGCEALARPTPSLADFHDVFRTSVVNLSITSDGGASWYRMIKQLSVEIAAAGGMQISTPSDELSDLFTPGQDVAVAKTLDDFIDHARYFLSHPEEARQMGLSSRRSLERHGGWQGWWQRVADLLAERGLSLDLTGEPIPPRQAATPLLLAAAGGLAHAYEAQGNAALAAVYFREVLGYRPDDYSALTGLARLEGRTPEARRLWREAAHAAGRTLNVQPPSRLHMPGIPVSGTHFAVHASHQWAELAMADGDYEDAILALPANCRLDPYYGREMADVFVEQGRPDLAKRSLDVHLRHWPDDAEALRLRGRLAAQSGDQVQSRADFARAMLIEQPRR